jgi:hypothetical protein
VLYCIKPSHIDGPACSEEGSIYCICFPGRLLCYIWACNSTALNDRELVLSSSWTFQLFIYLFSELCGKGSYLFALWLSYCSSVEMFGCWGYVVQWGLFTGTIWKLYGLPVIFYHTNVNVGIDVHNTVIPYLSLVPVSSFSLSFLLIYLPHNFGMLIVFGGCSLWQPPWDAYIHVFWAKEAACWNVPWSMSFAIIFCFVVVQLDDFSCL